MSSTNEDGGALASSPAIGERPKGRPGRKPKGTVPTVVADLPEKPDPDHVLTVAPAQGPAGHPRLGAAPRLSAIQAGDW